MEWSLLDDWDGVVISAVCCHCADAEEGLESIKVVSRPTKMRFTHLKPAWTFFFHRKFVFGALLWCCFHTPESDEKRQCTRCGILTFCQHVVALRPLFIYEVVRVSFATCAANHVAGTEVGQRSSVSWASAPFSTAVSRGKSMSSRLAKARHLVIHEARYPGAWDMGMML